MIIGGKLYALDGGAKSGRKMRMVKRTCTKWGKVDEEDANKMSATVLLFLFLFYFFPLLPFVISA